MTTKPPTHQGWRNQCRSHVNSDKRKKLSSDINLQGCSLRQSEDSWSDRCFIYTFCHRLPVCHLLCHRSLVLSFLNLTVQCSNLTIQLFHTYRWETNNTVILVRSGLFFYLIWDVTTQLYRIVLPLVYVWDSRLQKLGCQEQPPSSQAWLWVSLHERRYT